ncbi:MAG: imidazole glycerol phosphate synthase subunit HisH [Rhodospirillales bacterium]|nr:imidazole glycerol phosphate synthase subunit HisH [Rhodospirillales bacterium]
MSVVIVDYGSGNLRSAAKAFERAVSESGLGFPVIISSDPKVVAAAGHIVLPGVGAFADCRCGLDALPGMVEALVRTVIENGRPFLGICVGMQLMARLGREHGEHNGLGWIDGEVVLMPAASAGLKVPHMGWNDLQIKVPAHPLLTGIPAGQHAYFVHSYSFRPADPGVILATVDYGGEVVAVIGQDNLVGTQFHPEKSQATGLRLLGNFLRWRP